MAVILNEDSIQGISLGDGVTCQTLLDVEKTGNNHLIVEKWTLAQGARKDVEIPGENLAWIQIMGGEARLSGSAGAFTLADTSVAFFPPGFSGALECEVGASAL